MSRRYEWEWYDEYPPSFEPETNTAEWNRTHDGFVYTGPKDKQIEGDHYRKHAIQPIEYILKNNLGPCEANVVKYVTRWRDKGGVKDLRKAIHYLELLIDHEENKP
jgi:hypothetical protein